MPIAEIMPSEYFLFFMQNHSKTRQFILDTLALGYKLVPERTDPVLKGRHFGQLSRVGEAREPGPVWPIQSQYYHSIFLLIFWIVLGSRR